MPKTNYRYTIFWSKEDGDYVGLCPAFKSLSWLAETPSGALEGIMALVDAAVADMTLEGEALPPVPPPTYTAIMSGKELQVCRKLLMLDVKEAASILGGVSPRSWQYWEADRSSVPDDVADKVTALLTERQHIIERIEHDVTQYSTGKRLSYPYYATLDSFQAAHPGQGVLSWRVYQSALADLYAADLIRLA
jgi:predicted RNase H-like HicB family nuclease